MSKQEKQAKTHRHRQHDGGYQMGGGRVVKSKEGQIYGDGG